MLNKTVTVRCRIATGDGTAFVCGNDIYTITFDLDDEWSAEGYRTARFKMDNGEYIDVPFSGTVCNAPIFKDVKSVVIGLYEGDLHTTTGAAFPCIPSILCGTGTHAEPEKDVYNAIMDMLNKLQGADPEQIAEAVKQYLEENPVVSEESDPTVSAWAKQPEKPKYTAAEVGALPDDTPIPAPYVLPVASAATLGGVKPVAATDDMTQPVGVDAAGALFTAPGASGGASAETGMKLLLDYTREDEAVAGEGEIQCTEDVNGNTFEVREIMVVISGTVSANFPNAVQYVSIYSRNDCTKTDGGKMLSYTASRSLYGAAGTNYTSTINLSVFGNVWRAFVIGGQADTTIAQQAQETNDVPDLIRSISLACFGNSAWGNLPLTKGGNVKVYGRL